MAMMRSLFVLMAGLMMQPVMAQTIYTCTDASGGKVYTTSRDFSNCKALPKGPDSLLPPPPAGATPGAAGKPRPAGAAGNPTPAGFPRVAEDTQKARDGDRRMILEQELAGEQRNLELARKDLAEQEAVKGTTPDRIAPYRERVGQHERNIVAIQKELTNLK